LRLENAAYSVTEAGGEMRILVMRTNGNNVPVTVSFATSNGTAIAGEDYTATSGTLAFNAGESLKSFTIPILANAPVEGTETFNVTLSNPGGGATLGAPATATVAILDSEQTLAACNESSLRAAVSVGGRVVFPCDNTIVLTSPLIISNAVFLDGSGHAPVLSGSNVTRLFNVNPGVMLTLQSVTLNNGRASTWTTPQCLGGAIFNNGGQVILRDCSLVANMAGGHPPQAMNWWGAPGLGGAIYSSGGEVCATNTLFSANLATGDDEAYRGAGTGPGLGGALYQIGGEAVFLNCRLQGNHASSPPPGFSSVSGQALGGAIYHDKGVLLLRGCELAGNGAASASASGRGGAQSAQGGAAYSSSQTTIENCHIVFNGASSGSGEASGYAQGGALFLTGTAFVSRTFFENNSVSAGTRANGVGGSIYNGATLTMVDSTISASSAAGGSGALLFFTDWTDAGSGMGGGVFNSGTLFATNITLAGNTTAGGSTHSNTAPGTASGGRGLGGGVCDAGGTVVLIHATIAGNSTTGGAGDPAGQSLGGGIQTSGGSVTVLDTIIANSTSGGNASGLINDGGYNLSSDATCAFTAPTSLSNTNPLLGSLSTNGGPTPTMALLPGSPAIDAGGMGFAATDQRGYLRPFGTASDIGAFESGAREPYHIRGRVWGRTLVDKVSVLAGLNSTTTSNQGSYDLSGLLPATYTVTPSNANYVFVPASAQVTVGPDNEGIDFKAYRHNALSLEDVTNQTMHVVFAGGSGQSCRLLSSSNLLNWTPFTNHVIGPSSLWDLFLPIDTGNRYFRSVTP
jgi:hypothetical protein